VAHVRLSLSVESVSFSIMFFFYNKLANNTTNQTSEHACTSSNEFRPTPHVDVVC
jgi:hypothetical protein